MVEENILKTQPDEVQIKPTKSWLKIVLFSLLGLSFAAGLVFAGYKLGKKQAQPEVFLPPPTPTPSVISTPTLALSTSPSPTTAVTPTTYIEPSLTLFQETPSLTIPVPLVDTTNWEKRDYPSLGASFHTPPHWKLLSEVERGVTFNTTPGQLIPTNFSVILSDNPKGYGRRDFLWMEMLGYHISLEEGIRRDYVGLIQEWNIDGRHALSLHLKEYSGGGGYIAIPRGGQMLVIHIGHEPFSRENPEVYTVLSTFRFLE